ncbi:hypothetical protein F2Q68_00022650 [Brassica cretica]|uniref:Uncharacterized protein n=1 Tax=Brassica cretica TaxID=69181 RepID=A0A8S9G1L2_BRACR|nr:hypothetical protein F2Q68_00022650 [Brassica cretica]
MVEPVNSSLGKMLLEEVSPVVMVLCTPLVEETFLKNGLSFVETLKPFCNFSNIDVPVRTSGDQLYRLKKFMLRLFNAADIRQPNVEVAKQRLEHVITQAGEKVFHDLKSDPPQITDILSNQSIKEAEYCMENASSTYMKLGKSGFQNATRCGLWWAEMLKARDQYKEAASVYFRICGEEPLHAAVMLEQASYCFVLTKPAMLHKYGFHLVLSGDHYKICDQVNHAIRTYRSAISVYESTTWSHIKDHVYFHIGQWYAIVGMNDVAVRNMLRVLDCGNQSKSTQEIFLRDFFDIVKKTGMKHEVVGLRLPVINMSSLQVIYEDHRTYASQASALVEESIWQSLEDDIIPSLNSGKSNWLELQSKLLPKKYKESNVCVVGGMQVVVSCIRCLHESAFSS